jgi:hypothetical protein
MGSLRILHRSVLSISQAQLCGSGKDLSSLRLCLYGLSACSAGCTSTHEYPCHRHLHTAASTTAIYQKLYRNSWNLPREQWGIWKNRGFATEPGADDSGKIDIKARETVWTLSNSISLARFVSAPLLGWWIVTGQWQLCLSGLALAGVRPELSRITRAW